MDKIKIKTQVNIIRGTHVDGLMNYIEVNKERKIERWKVLKGLVLGLAFVQELVLGQVKVVARYSLKDGDKGEIVWVGDGFESMKWEWR